MGVYSNVIYVTRIITGIISIATVERRITISKEYCNGGSKNFHGLKVLLQIKSITRDVTNIAIYLTCSATNS